MKIYWHCVFRTGNRTFKVIGMGWSKELGEFWQIVEVDRIKHDTTIVYNAVGESFRRSKEELVKNNFEILAG